MPTAEEITEQMQMKGCESQQENPEPVFRQPRGDNSDERRSDRTMREHVMPLPVGIDTGQQREPVEIGRYSGVRNQKTISPLREMLADQPGNNQMTGWVHRRP